MLLEATKPPASIGAFLHRGRQLQKRGPKDLPVINRDEFDDLGHVGNVTECRHTDGALRLAGRHDSSDGGRRKGASNTTGEESGGGVTGHTGTGGCGGGSAVGGHRRSG